MIAGNFENIAFEGISIDSRTLKAGNLFFALAGMQQDGHDFIEQAYQKGAAGAVVLRTIQTKLPLIKVRDTIQTLGEITKNWRDTFDIPLIGVTGSNGKTTTKNMIGAIFQAMQKFPLVTQGNFNNHIGVPLTLAQLDTRHQAAVIEMGMNHFHEISSLTRLARPTTALITNAGSCHLEGLDGTLAGVAKAKGEIFEGLSLKGTAVINADDDFAAYWKSLIKTQTIITYGIEKEADVKAELKAQGFVLNYQGKQVFIKLKLLGKHNISNALAAAAAALVNGAELAQIKTALEKLEPAQGRMETKKGLKGVTVIDDTYNANPLSLKAAIEAIRDFPGQKILVLGAMGELGAQGESLHSKCGKFARENGIDYLFTMGELTRHTINSFGKNGRYFTDHVSLIEALQPYIQLDNIILVKGSRSMKMEKVVEAITLLTSAKQEGN
jgi:UDP-N-acetylmuramoyl-tripeptide--D-alanyl-D-alanine ligase